MSLLLLFTGGPTILVRWPYHTDTAWATDSQTRWPADTDDEWAATAGARWELDTEDRW